MADVCQEEAMRNLDKSQVQVLFAARMYVWMHVCIFVCLSGRSHEKPRQVIGSGIVCSSYACMYE